MLNSFANQRLEEDLPQCPNQQYNQTKQEHQDANAVNAVHHLEVEIGCFVRPIGSENVHKIEQHFFHNRKTDLQTLSFFIASLIYAHCRGE